MENFFHSVLEFYSAFVVFVKMFQGKSKKIKLLAKDLIIFLQKAPQATAAELGRTTSYGEKFHLFRNKYAGSAVTASAGNELDHINNAEISKNQVFVCFVV